jgi:site-specific DNA recombinase
VSPASKGTLPRSPRGNHPHPLSALIYARVSTDEQTRGFSLPTQLASCRAYAAERGYHVVGEYTDDFTGTEPSRPGLDALLDALRDGVGDVVVVHDLDRLGRGAGVLAIIEHTIERLGARVEYVLAQGQYDSPEGALLKAIKAAISGYENVQRVERSRRGSRGRVQAGHPLIVGGKTPYGYRYEGGRHHGRLVPDPVEAEVVREMFEWLVHEKLTTYQIAKRLSERRVPTRGDTCPPAGATKKALPGIWNSATVHQMLRNPLYKGQYTYGATRRQRRGEKVVQVPTPDQAVTCPVPAIVTPELWEAAQAQLRENGRLARRNRRRDYLLAGLIRCAPPCGRAWCGQFDPRTGRRYYRAALRIVDVVTPDGAGPSHKHGFTLPADVLEAAAWGWVCEELIDPDRVLAELERRAQGAAAERDRLTRQLQAAEAAIADLDRKLSTLLAKELDGYPGEVLAGHRKALLAQRAELAARRDALARRLAAPDQAVPAVSPDAVFERLNAIADRLPAMHFAERRQLLLDLRVQVIVEGRDRVRVEGLLPTATLELTPPDLVRELGRLWWPALGQPDGVTGLTSRTSWQRNYITVSGTIVLPAVSAGR